MTGEVRKLAEEIGALFSPGQETAAFKARWVTALAVLVAAHAHRCPYSAQLQTWVDQIDNATDRSIAAVLDAVRDELEAIDDDDGWATDAAGAALQAVTLGLMPNTRWMAEAGNRVWGLVVGSGCGFNDVIKFSRAAWLRDLYGRCAP